MFDELARRGNGHGDHVVLASTCNIPAALQKRLSLVSHSQRGSIFGSLSESIAAKKSQQQQQQQHLHQHQQDRKAQMEETVTSSQDASGTTEHVEITISHQHAKEEDEDAGNDCNNSTTMVSNNREEKSSLYRRESGGLTPLRYSRRGRNTGRPLSGSSIASSTSSSGCSNQGNACTANPYLASVESLADTCASSQGSGDSGVVVTVSAANCQIGNDNSISQRRNIGDGSSLIYHRPRYCDPHRNTVERVLLEIVDTEAIYVEHLRQVIQGYLIFWRDDPASLVQQLQLNGLFSNIEDIFEFNREFLKELEDCGLDPVCVANTFIKHNSGFKVYTEYCTNYPRTVSVLTELMGQEETADAFRERQAALGHALPLGSFLLKPVQRILKYHLLLENLSKEYGAGSERGEDDPDGRIAIDEALEAMTGIAKHINAMKRRHEHSVRVQEIQSLLYGWPGRDLTTSGELIAEGRFRMRGAKAPRHAFLFERMLLLTKKKEDGLLVYKAHIMCSNLMLIESIPGEPLSFHVIPFDNPRLQYTLQARNLEQKREWTLQIKRVMLENYNAVIPSHARQLVLQLGQSQADEDTSLDKSAAKKQSSAPPEYLEKRKQERERRRSEIGLRQKLKKGTRKSDSQTPTAENSPVSSCKNRAEESVHGSRDTSLNRSSEGRAYKVKDRFVSWRRKSEPGFQSYVSLSQSDEEQKENLEDANLDTPIATPTASTPTTTPSTPSQIHPQAGAATTASSGKEPLGSEPFDSYPANNSVASETKDINEQQQSSPVQQSTAQTVEEIVGHILMQNEEFQKLLEKQRTNSIINVRQQQRFNKHINPDTTDESEDEEDEDEDDLDVDADDDDEEDIRYTSANNKTRVRPVRREQRLVKMNNAWNSTKSGSTAQREKGNHPNLRLQLRHDNLRDCEKLQPNEELKRTKASRVQEKKALFEAFKRQSIVTESKIIKTALRIRDHSMSAGTEEVEKQEEEEEDVPGQQCKGFGNYDNLQHVWESIRKEGRPDDSPTRPAIWLTKLCEGLPTSPTSQKCGSLPRSFQMSPSPSPISISSISKSRFLQRDGKPMSERPFTIASDKPAEINLEDMERYASNCQPEGRIAKFPTSSGSNSTFFCALDESLTDAYSEIHVSSTSSTSTNIHPDHKIYRPNSNNTNNNNNNNNSSSSSSSTSFRNVLFKAGSKLQGLRTTLSTETLECHEELERTKYFRSLSSGKIHKKKTKAKSSKESSSDVEEFLTTTAGLRVPPQLYYKQGSSSLGARIAQSDYADPTVLFSENNKRTESRETLENRSSVRKESENDSFYEKSFETIENYVDADVDDVFRDSAIFSDADEGTIIQQLDEKLMISGSGGGKSGKVAPPVPLKRKSEAARVKPDIARKPEHLRMRSKQVAQEQTRENGNLGKQTIANDDVSAGQSQAGWVKKMVGQLQGQVGT